MVAWNKFWIKWSLRFDMFLLGVSATFFVGVFSAARYSKLSSLRTMAHMNGFTKTVYNYLKFKNEQKAEGPDPWVLPFTGIRDTRLMLLQRTMNQKFLLEVDIALFCIRLRMIYIMIYIYIPHCNLFFVLFLLFLYCL